MDPNSLNWSCTIHKGSKLTQYKRPLNLQFEILPNQSSFGHPHQIITLSISLFSLTDHSVNKQTKHKEKKTTTRAAFKLIPQNSRIYFKKKKIYS